MRVRILRDTILDDAYLVILGEAVYEMSSNAEAANGVNMYVGEYSELVLRNTEEISLSAAPKGVLCSALARLRG